MISAKLAKLEKLANIGIWELDILTNRLTWSRQIYKIFELDYRNFNPSYEAFLNLIHPEDREAVNCAYLHSLKTKEKYKIVHRLLFPDGRIKYVEEQCDTIFDDNGVAMISSGTVQDITEHILQQKENEKQKQELEIIFNTTRDGIAITDLESNFIKVNKAYCEITGLSEEELLSTSCLALTLPEDIEKTKYKIEELFENGFTENYEKRCNINGRIIDVSFSLAVLPDEKHILVSMRDISKNKKYEEKEKLASMGEMIGNIAHQWRQPLNVISTIASGISFRKEMGTLESYDITNDMKLLMTQTNYLSQTIEDFRNFIKNTKEFTTIHIGELINSMHSIIESTLKANNIELVVDIEEDFTIECYKNEIIQSLINIINNSKDAITQNQQDSEMRVVILRVNKQTNINTLMIQDSGGGIPSGVMERIFEPYFTTKHQSHGTGIGLSMTHRILTERHNFEISVRNNSFVYNDTSLEGALFTITFKDK